jgi:glycosyltransferase involved in cell wall biosynthesis
MRPLTEMPSQQPRGRRKLLSVLIPVFNEERLIGTLLDRVATAPLPEGIDRELCLVDDASTDGSLQVMKAYATRYPGLVRLGRHEVNRGKGAAIRTALGLSGGDYCIVQDADLEYDPREIGRLLLPLIEDRADVVFGSRFNSAGERRVIYFWHTVANKLLTLLCNMVANLNLTDMETCYKAFRTPLLKSIPLRQDRFGIEPELTIKVAKRKARIYETPISYHGRTYEEGKKIGIRDAIDAVWVIFRFSMTRDLHFSEEVNAAAVARAAPSGY